MSYNLFSDAAKDTALDAVGGTIMGSQEVELLKQVFVAAGQGNSFASITGDPADNAELAEYLQGGFPIVISARNITVLTNGAPADIASITLPSWFTRGSLLFATSSAVSSSRVIAETASGTLAGASISLFGSAGGVNALNTTQTLPASAGASVGLWTTATGGNIFGPSTAYGNDTIYIRQTANSANAGTISVYLVLMPFL